MVGRWLFVGSANQAHTTGWINFGGKDPSPTIPNPHVRPTFPVHLPFVSLICIFVAHLFKTRHCLCPSATFAGCDHSFGIYSAPISPHISFQPLYDFPPKRACALHPPPSAMPLMDQRELDLHVKQLTKCISANEPAENALRLLETLKKDASPTEEMLRVCLFNNSPNF